MKDFVAGLPSGFVFAKEADTASNDVKFASALKLLVGDAKALEDVSAGGLLESVDIGARNLVAVRAVQIEQIVAAAKEKLKDKTITGIEASAQAALAARAQPTNKLGADVLRRLSETPEFEKLNELYRTASADASPAGVTRAKLILAERNKLEVAALSATVAEDPTTKKQVVQYTQSPGATPTTFNNIVPESLNDDATRANKAAIIARFILAGAKNDASYQAVMAAVGGDGQRGGSLESGLANGAEREAAKQVPAAYQAIKDGAAGCESPKDAFRNDLNTYAARQRERAADKTTSNQNVVAKINEDRDAALEKNKTTCSLELEAAGALQKKHDFESVASLEARRSAARDAAKIACDKRVIDITKVADDALAARVIAEQKDNADLIIQAADKTVTDGLKAQLRQSVKTLRAQYLARSSARQKKLIKDAGLSGPGGQLDGYTTTWFDDNWPGVTLEATLPASAKLQAAIDACAQKLGLGESVGSKNAPSYVNPQSTDKVADACGIHDSLSKSVKAEIGTVDESTRR